LELVSALMDRAKAFIATEQPAPALPLIDECVALVARLEAGERKALLSPLADAGLALHRGKAFLAIGRSDDAREVLRMRSVVPKKSWRSALRTNARLHSPRNVGRRWLAPSRLQRPLSTGPSSTENFSHNCPRDANIWTMASSAQTIEQNRPVSPANHEKWARCGVDRSGIATFSCRNELGHGPVHYFCAARVVLVTSC
jgi:hypothetical protein